MVAEQYVGGGDPGVVRVVGSRLPSQLEPLLSCGLLAARQSEPGADPGQAGSLAASEVAGQVVVPFDVSGEIGPHRRPDHLQLSCCGLLDDLGVSQCGVHGGEFGQRQPLGEGDGGLCGHGLLPAVAQPVSGRQPVGEFRGHPG